ncbi:hypothetical protein [Oceanobacillus sp. CF4.6]|uniref:hypothetical protein n=1 Tax=Oceanobacillus sp. CF4.6 TaxID=3373080 RepID=UPI003EE6F663
MLKIGVPMFVLILIVILAYILSKQLKREWTYVVWGIATIVPIAPLLSWIISYLYAYYEGDGFAGIALFGILLPLLFLLGLVLIAIGIYRVVRKKGSV